MVFSFFFFFSSFFYSSCFLFEEKKRKKKKKKILVMLVELHRDKGRCEDWTMVGARRLCLAWLTKHIPRQLVRSLFEVSSHQSRASFLVT